MICIEAPNRNIPSGKKSIFLAGGITNCPDWQQNIVDQLTDQDVILFNPRRKNFPIDDPNAAEEQITWEHDMFRKSDMIVFWFCAETMCPIVLYELGSWSMTNKPIVIGMDKKYQRRQDVEMQTKLVRPDIPITYNFDDFVSLTKNMIQKNITNHFAKIQVEFIKEATAKERLKKPLNVDLDLELRIGGNANPSWKIDTNIDEEEYSYYRDSGEEPTKQNYLEWAAQLREIAKWLTNEGNKK